MLKKLLPTLLIVLITNFTANAHFLELIPSTDIVTAKDSKTIGFDLAFSHPMENGPAMELVKPTEFFVQHQDGKDNLIDSLTPFKVDGKSAYKAEYLVKKPGDHIFGVEPAPYWEPSEGKLIIHYTKVIVNGFGEENLWSEPLNFPVEITPLVRPYGLWTGNLFRGVVKHNGEPVPFAEIEVEYLNKDSKVDIPSSPFVTQVITADQNGVFSYAMVKAGWWAFAALVDGEKQEHQGAKVDVELGGLIWVNCVNMSTTK